MSHACAASLFAPRRFLNQKPVLRGRRWASWRAIVSATSCQRSMCLSAHRRHAWASALNASQHTSCTAVRAQLRPCAVGRHEPCTNAGRDDDLFSILYHALTQSQLLDTVTKRMRNTTSTVVPTLGRGPLLPQARAALSRQLLACRTGKRGQGSPPPTQRSSWHMRRIFGSIW